MTTLARHGLRRIGAQAPNAGKAHRGRCGALLPGWMLLSLILLAGCHREAPEQALRETIASMQSAAEANDSTALFAPIAEDFAGSEGMDRQAFRRYVALLGLRNSRIGVSLGPLDVKLFGDRASARFTVALTGGAGLLPERAQVYDVDTGWRMERGNWKLISARWEARL